MLAITAFIILLAIIVSSAYNNMVLKVGGSYGKLYVQSECHIANILCNDTR